METYESVFGSAVSMAGSAAWWAAQQNELQKGKTLTKDITKPTMTATVAKKKEAGKVKIPASEGLISMAEYRSKPMKEHSLAQKKRYVGQMQKEYAKLTEGKKVWVSIKGKNVEATITKNIITDKKAAMAAKGKKSVVPTSVNVEIGGKERRTDLAQIYGFV
jgi:hypothetical protein